MKYKYLLTGIIKSLPGIEYLYNFHKHSGGDTASARYCYSIWLRHLVLAYKNGLTEIPEIIIEIGPGHSLGLGIAALLSGARKYYGLDLINYYNASTNLDVLKGLINLFINKAPIPDNNEFPLIEPRLDDYSFPDHIITDAIIAKIMQGDVVYTIEGAIKDVDLKKPDQMIVYAAPWFDVEIEKNSVDLILSQTVLQHVDSVEKLYGKMNLWLKSKGMMSHTIDFQSMLSSDDWYGHWTYTDLEWKIIRGRKNFHINRLPLSSHLRLLAQDKFTPVYITKKKESDTLSRTRLAKRFKELTDEDLSTSVSFFQAVKTDN